MAVPVQPAVIQGRRYNLLGPVNVPSVDAIGDPDLDSAVRFLTQIPGRIVGLRFYKDERDTIPHVGRLWDPEQRAGPIGELAFENETIMGWQIAYFTHPIRIEPRKSYAVSVNNSGPHFVAERFFHHGYVNGPLSAPRFASTRFPSASTTLPHPRFWNDDSNYWVDIIFEETPVRRPRTAPAQPPRVIGESGVDIRLVQDARFPMQGVTIDWSLRPDGTLDDTQALATAMIVALGTDRRADLNEQLPDPDSADRRGWWGDLDAEAVWSGWPIGSKLWLLKREKIVGGAAWQGSTTSRIERYIREAVEPFLMSRLRIGSQVEVRVTRHGGERIDALVRLYRGPITEIELRYSVLWSDIQRAGDTYDIGGGHREREI